MAKKAKKFKDVETGEVTTSKQWIRRLTKEAKSIASDAYCVGGYDLFQALLADKKLVEVSE